jgi:hypothetical protein
VEEPILLQAVRRRQFCCAAVEYGTGPYRRTDVAPWMQRPGCMLQPCCNLYKGTCGRPSAATARRFSKPLRARSASARPPPKPSTHRTLCEYSRASCVRTPEYPVRVPRVVRCSLHPVSPLGVRSPCSAGTAAGMVATDAGITCNAYKGTHRLIRPRSAERASCKRRLLRCRVRAPLVLCRAQYANPHSRPGADVAGSCHHSSACPPGPVTV